MHLDVAQSSYLRSFEHAVPPTKVKQYVSRITGQTTGITNGKSCMKPFKVLHYTIKQSCSANRGSCVLTPLLLLVSFDTHFLLYTTIARKPELDTDATMPLCR